MAGNQEQCNLSMCGLLENYFQVFLDLLWMNIGKQIWDGWNKMLWC